MSNAYEELYNKIKTLNKQWFYDKTEITSLINGKANVNHAHTDKEDAIEFITGTTTNSGNVFGGTSTKLNSLQNGTKILYKTPAQSSTDINTAYLQLTLANGTTNNHYLCDATGGFLMTKEIPANTVLLLVYVTSFQSRWQIISRSNDATTNSSGLMSKTDKAKLDGLSNFSGSYNDLTDKPTIPDVSGKADASHQHGNILNNGTVTASDTGVYTYVGGLDSRGDFYKTNKVNASSIIDRTAHTNINSSADATQSAINTKIDSALGGKANSTHSHTKSQITDFPTLGNLAYEDNVENYVGDVALSNDYNDLDNKPTIPTVGAVALSNDYDDLDNKPTIPTVNNLDSGFTTSTMQTTNVITPTGSSDLMQYHFNQSVNEDIGDLWTSIQNKANSTHTHTKSQITDFPTIPDVSGKEDKSNKVTSLSSASTDTQYPSAKAVYNKLADKADKTSVVDWDNIVFVDKTDDSTGSIILNFLS